MRRLVAILGAGLATWLVAAPAWTHHAFSAEFDANRPVKFRGVVTRMEWVNPHSWLHLEVKGTDGKLENWMVELGPPGALVRRGWSKQSVPPGIELLVEGFQAKDGSRRANGRDVTMPDGRRLFVGSSGTGAPDERPDK